MYGPPRHRRLQCPVLTLAVLRPLLSLWAAALVAAASSAAGLLRGAAVPGVGEAPWQLAPAARQLRTAAQRTSVHSGRCTSRTALLARRQLARTESAAAAGRVASVNVVGGSIVGAADSTPPTAMALCHLVPLPVTAVPVAVPVAALESDSAAAPVEAFVHSFTPNPC
jgi:hypothetical protein